jgi:hypothetical protein
MHRVGNHRPQTRQTIVDHWFARFVENELYDKSDYHVFCTRVKGLSVFEIERIFKQETRNI